MSASAARRKQLSQSMSASEARRKQSQPVSASEARRKMMAAQMSDLQSESGEEISRSPSRSPSPDIPHGKKELMSASEAMRKMMIHNSRNGLVSEDEEEITRPPRRNISQPKSASETRRKMATSQNRRKLVSEDEEEIPRPPSRVLSPDIPRGKEKRYAELLDKLAHETWSFPTRVLRTSDMKLMQKNEVCRELAAYLIKKESEVEWSSSSRRRQLMRRRPHQSEQLKSITQYAILSHRWSELEPTFRDMTGGGDSSILNKSQPGFNKLVNLCRVADQLGYNWAWADTVCIDKSSSAELDEAIRSMYRWYKGAAVCLVHLAGTVCDEDVANDPWFTRVWTLQELLAPECIKFYTKDWEPLTQNDNDKMEGTFLISVLSHATTIPAEDLCSFYPATDRIREKMSWVARRQTTRIEDLAYSLIGIFDVSLTTAYGEGWQAFYRLQLAIMEQTNSLELFIWEDSEWSNSPWNSMIAAEPSSFICDKDLDPLPRLYDLPPSVLRRIGPDTLRMVDPQLLGNCGYELLEQMDLETLQRVGPYLVQIFPSVNELMDRKTLERMDRDMSWIPWGGRTYAMTNGGLCIEVVLYNVEWSGTGPARKYAADEDDHRYRDDYSDPEGDASDAESDSESLREELLPTIDPERKSVTIPADYFECDYSDVHEAKLAILDYHPEDTFEDPTLTQLQQALDRSRLHHREAAKWVKNSSCRDFIITEVKNRLYKAVLIQPHDRGDCYVRLARGKLVRVNRPSSGWGKPKAVYIK